jgi:hypothetical protein
MRPGAAVTAGAAQRHLQGCVHGNGLSARRCEPSSEVVDGGGIGNRSGDGASRSRSGSDSLLEVRSDDERGEAEQAEDLPHRRTRRQELEAAALLLRPSRSPSDDAQPRRVQERHPPKVDHHRRSTLLGRTDFIPHDAAALHVDVAHHLENSDVVGRAGDDEDLGSVNRHAPRRYGAEAGLGVDRPIGALVSGRGACRAVAAQVVRVRESNRERIREVVASAGRWRCKSIGSGNPSGSGRSL